MTDLAFVEEAPADAATDEWNAARLKLPTYDEVHAKPARLNGLIQRAQTQRDDLGKLETLLWALLNKVRGSQKPPATDKEGIDTGMPALFDTTERRIKSCMKLASDISEMF